MSKTPYGADDGSGTDGTPAAHDGGHGNNVIGVGRVPRPKKEAEGEDCCKSHS